MNQGKIAEKAMREAVKETTERQLKLGVPVVFMRNGKICTQLPNGEIIEDS